MRVQNETFTNHKRQQNFGNILIQGEKSSEKVINALVKTMPDINTEKIIKSSIKFLEGVDIAHPKSDSYVIDIRTGGKDSFQLFAGKEQISMVYPTEMVKINPIQTLLKRLTESFEYLRDDVLGY